MRKPRKRIKFTAESIKKLKPESERYSVMDTEVPGFELRISPSGVKTYSLTYRTHDGKRERFTIGRHGSATPESARKAAKDLLAKVTLQRKPQAEKREARRQTEMPTFGEFIGGEYGVGTDTPALRQRYGKATEGDFYGTHRHTA